MPSGHELTREPAMRMTHRPDAGRDEPMRRRLRTVDEVPCSEGPLLSLDQQQALARVDEEIVRLWFVVNVRDVAWETNDAVVAGARPEPDSSRRASSITFSTLPT